MLFLILFVESALSCSVEKTGGILTARSRRSLLHIACRIAYMHVNSASSYQKTPIHLGEDTLGARGGAAECVPIPFVIRPSDAAAHRGFFFGTTYARMMTHHSPFYWP